MQIFRSLMNRVISVFDSASTDRPRAIAIMALSAAAALPGSTLAQSIPNSHVDVPNEAGDYRNGWYTQAPLAGVPQVGGSEQISPLVTDMPSVIGPPMVDNSSIYGRQQFMGSAAPQFMGSEIPCPSGPGCNVSFYGSFEALWLKHENDQRFTLSRNDRFDDFDYDFAGRYTVGRIWDCVNGIEAVYAGPFNWDRTTFVTGAGNLTSRFVPSGGYTANEVSAFNSADLHSQAHEIDLNSYEINRRWWQWDVLSTMIGVRAVDYRERYAFFSSRPAVGNGIFVEQTQNILVGLQIGGDLMYPIGLRTIVGMRGKAGVFANFDEATVLLNNAGTTVLDSKDTSVDVAGVIEYGIFARYQIVPSIRLMAGYEFWYLPGVATVPGQPVHQVHPDSGSSVNNDDQVFIHGGSVGVQVLF